MKHAGAMESRGVKEALRESALRLLEASSVLVLTGAGTSAESGVPTFRGAEGLWRSFRPEELATRDAFAADPLLVWEFYSWRRERIAPLRPNPAHEAIVALERRGRTFLLATQNVDGLHELAGSQSVVELHGNLWRMRCAAGCSAAFYDRSVPLKEMPPSCRCGSLLRPDVVWFGESLEEEGLERARLAAEAADVVLVVGTSSLVYPAAALQHLALRKGAFVIEVNPEETPLTASASVSIRDRAAKAVPALLEPVSL